MKIAHWQDWIILGCAAWLYASPFVLGEANLQSPPTVLSWVCAVVLMVSAFEAIAFPDVIEEWVDVIVAVALIAGPWVLGFGGNTALTANSVGVGALVLSCAISAIARERERRAAAPRKD